MFGLSFCRVKCFSLGRDAIRLLHFLSAKTSTRTQVHHKVAVKLKYYHPLHDITPSKTGGGRPVADRYRSQQANDQQIVAAAPVTAAPAAAPVA